MPRTKTPNPESIELNNLIDSQKTVTLKRVHWKRILRRTKGDPFAVRPNSAMLVEGHPHLINRGVSLPDKDSATGWKQVFLQVEYDREYVVLWLVEKVIKPFSHCDFQTIQKLIGDAYRLHKELKTQIGKEGEDDFSDLT